MPIKARFYLLLCLTASACSMGPDYTPPAANAPDTYIRDANQVSQADDKTEMTPEWWHVMNDPLLDKLVSRVADENLDVLTASARLGESRAERGIVAADFFPQIDGSASYMREKLSDKGIISIESGLSGGGGSGGASAASGGGSAGIPSSSATPAFKVYQYGFDASWEIDLWGRVRRGVEAADATIEADEDARRGALISSISELVRDYVQWRGTQANIAVLRKESEATQQVADLVAKRARVGLNSDIDLANAKAQAATALAQIPPMEQQEASLKNAMALLLGLAPGALNTELAASAPIPPIPPKVPIGVPSELVERRPDIRQSSAQLHAATAQIGVAEADFMPKLTLMGDGMLQSLNLNTLNEWAARSYTFGPSISLPIFEGGRLVSTYDLRDTQQQEAAIQYRKTVLTAFHEVDNALTAFRAEQTRRDALAKASAEDQRALHLAIDRYKKGLGDFITVLTDEQNLMQAEEQEIKSTANTSVNMVELYKALGGGWETSFPRHSDP